MEINGFLSWGIYLIRSLNCPRLDPHEIDLSDGETDCCKLGDNWQ